MEKAVKHILLFETELTWKGALEEALGRFGKQEEYEVILIDPRFAGKDRKKELSVAADAINRARPYLDAGTVALAYVDIVVDELTGSFDSFGFEIAAEIRRLTPFVPVYLVSGKYGAEQHLKIISEASFQDVDGVLAKQYAITNLDVGTFTTLLSRPRKVPVLQQQRLFSAVGEMDGPKEAAGAHTTTAAPVFVSDHDRVKLSIKAEEIVARFGASARKPRIRTIASAFIADRFWRLLGECLRFLQAPSASIQVLTPGRSGAVALTITFDPAGANAPRTVFIKVSEDLRGIQKEIAAYDRTAVQSTVDRRSVPRVLRPLPFTCDGLAALMTDFESDTVTLREWLPKNGDGAEGVAKRLVKVLEAFYLGGDKRTTELWPEYYKLSDADVATIEVAIAEVAANVDESIIPAAVIERVKTFVRTNGGSESAVMEMKTTARIRRIHGDLNSGNVLVAPDHEVVLIDFARSDLNSVAFDPAKLERDIAYRIADRASPAFSDWANIPQWRQLTAACATVDLSPGAVPERLGSLVRFIAAVRSTAAGYSSTDVDMRERLLAALHFVLKAIALPDISIQKQALAVLNCADLLDTIKTHSSK